MTTTHAGEVWLAEVEFADRTRSNLVRCWYCSVSHQRLWAKLGNISMGDWRRVAEVWNSQMHL